jgi:anti-sigma factor ChrR (cupin superfamily)
MIDDPRTWVLGVPPIQGHVNFRPGPSHAPLRGGFARMSGGMRLPEHRHTDRELTFVLEGELYDGAGNGYGPGDHIDMAPGSVHSLAVPDGGEALVALLHGRIEML